MTSQLETRLTNFLSSAPENGFNEDGIVCDALIAYKKTGTLFHFHAKNGSHISLERLRDIDPKTYVKIYTKEKINRNSTKSKFCFWFGLSCD